MRISLLIVLATALTGCSTAVFKSNWTRQTAPNIFTARFETNKGNFDIEVKREWSPYAVDRLYQLLKHHFYDHAIFYRGVPNFVVQFGSTDTVLMAKWNNYKIPDEKVIYGNARGSLSFARGGKESRGSELFINLKNNNFLDSLSLQEVKGFPAFGNVTHGMEVVESLYTGYGDRTMDKLDTLYINRLRFLEIFPKLDSIYKAYILKKN